MDEWWSDVAAVEAVCVCGALARREAAACAS
jgi:hypothetical protein